MAPSGIAPIDSVTGGIPKGALTQVCSPRWNSSGKTALLLSLVAQTTNQGEFCALVDAGDCFDPLSAEAAGISLSHLLWVRCSQRGSVPALEQAFKAADILMQNGGFGLVAVDLGNQEERLVRKIPLTTWFRFSRVIEKMPTALVFLAPDAYAHSCSALTLHLASIRPRWDRIASVSHGRLLDGMDFEAEITRARLKKPVASAKPKFTARAEWLG